jgi:hypothetical protein
LKVIRSTVLFNVPPSNFVNSSPLVHAKEKQKKVLQERYRAAAWANAEEVKRYVNAVRLS